MCVCVLSWAYDSASIAYSYDSPTFVSYSYDDSSSLSSGISDPWNDVYGLHYKVILLFFQILLDNLKRKMIFSIVIQMEHNGVYPVIPNGYGTPLQNRRHPPPSAVAETSPYK